MIEAAKVGVGGSLESEDAEEACPLVSLIDGDVSGIVGLVRYADGTLELRSVGRLAAIDMWPRSDVGG